MEPEIEAKIRIVHIFEELIALFSRVPGAALSVGDVSDIVGCEREIAASLLESLCRLGFLTMKASGDYQVARGSLAPRRRVRQSSNG